MFEPVATLLDRHEIEIAVQRVHLAHVARRMLINRAGPVEALDDRLGPHRLCSPDVGPAILGLAAREGVENAVDPLGILVLRIAGRVVAGRVRHHRRMVLCLANVDLSIFGVAVGPLRFGAVPAIARELGLGVGNQHAHVVGRSKNLLETHVGAGAAGIVVRVGIG